MKNTEVSKRKAGGQATGGQPPKSDPTTVRVPTDLGKSEDRSMADFGLSTVAKNAVTAAVYGSQSLPRPIPLTESIDATRDKVKKVKGGCMDEPEAMLVAQSQTLDAIFNTLAQRALANMGNGHIDAADKYLRLALKAQGQCRTTIEALNEIKFPRTPTFVRQQNIATQQQVNNGVPARAHEKDITPTNELLEQQHAQRLDIGTSTAAGRADPVMASVGAVDRTQDRAG